MFFLVTQDGDGMPSHFAPRVGRDHGAASGWVGDPDKALQFAREQDARDFMEVYLPALAPFCTLTRHERPV